MFASPSPSNLKLTRRAFQNRFPLMAGSVVATKYDAMTLFMSDATYAAELEPNGAARTALKLDIQAGLNRMAVIADVDYGINDAAQFTHLLTQERIPVDFRLTSDERDVILSPQILEAERP